MELNGHFMTKKVINFSDFQKEKENSKKRMVYIYQESGVYDGLYYKDNDPEMAYRIKILFWAIDNSGNIVALVPYLKEIRVLEELNNESKMHFAGYYDTYNEEIIYELPEFKVKEINNYKTLFDGSSQKEQYNKRGFNQLIQDSSGIHGVFVHIETEELSIVPIHSWCLYENGEMEPFIVKEKSLHLSPIILTGTKEDDSHIESMFSLKNFSYYFTYETAQRVKDSIVNGGEIEMSDEFFENISKK